MSRIPQPRRDISSSNNNNGSPRLDGPLQTPPIGNHALRTISASAFHTNNPFARRIHRDLLPSTPPSQTTQTRPPSPSRSLSPFPGHGQAGRQSPTPHSPPQRYDGSRVPSPSARPSNRYPPSNHPHPQAHLSSHNGNGTGGMGKSLNRRKSFGGNAKDHADGKKVRKVPSSLARRPVPTLSPEKGQAGGGLHPGDPGKTCLRQPSVPILRNPYQGPIGRKRATSVTISTAPPSLAPAALIHSRPSTFYHSSNPSFSPPRAGNGTGLGAPAHIRLRLKLLSHLAHLLDVDQSEMAKKIDIPGLLARVDQAYEKRAALDRRGREIGFIGVPMPTTTAVDKETEVQSGKSRQRTFSGDDPNDDGTEGWWMFPADHKRRETPLGSSGNTTDLGENRFGLTASLSFSNFGLGLGLGIGKDKTEKDRKEGKDKKGNGQGVLGRFNVFGKKSEEAPPAAKAEVEDRQSRLWKSKLTTAPYPSRCPANDPGPIFGISLVDLPVDGWCTTRVGGQRHELPIPVFILAEELYRRGMSQPGLFRLAGKEDEVTRYHEICDTAPFYGEGTDLSIPNVHSLSNVLKRFLRDLPEPLLDESLLNALWEWCCAPDFPPGAMNTKRMTTSDPGRIQGAIMCMKLLPPQHFSMLVYCLAFVTQLQFFPGNRLTLDAIAIIFGPALLAPRDQGIPGLGTGSKGVKHDSQPVSALVDQSQKTLGWLIRNWPTISLHILEPPFSKTSKTENGHCPTDPSLLSPIDMRGSSDSPFAAASSRSTAKSLDLDRKQIKLVDIDRFPASVSGSSLNFLHGPTTKTPGLLRTALSSMNLSRSFHENGEQRMPKRSASFNNLSSALKLGKKAKEKDKDYMETPQLRHSPASVQSSVLETPPNNSDEFRRVYKSGINPQITNVLGSLQDLLMSRDRQIERDARELAVLRHTLLEMDEKLQRALTTKNLSSLGQPSPEIKITTSTSTTTLNDSLITDLQSQLHTALSALSQARDTTRQKDRQLVDLHAAMARAESQRKVEIGKLDMALALETAKNREMREERDLARERLDKVKKELFAVP